MTFHPHIHIVSFDVPFPPDYGGVAAVLHKIKSLHKEGVKIILHCFNYGRGEATQLEAFCKEVIYYKRKAGLRGFHIIKPYIVNSRINKDLINNLNKDGAPIIFEGVHTTGVIPFIENEDRKIVVRLHNIEADYYKTLAGYEKKFFKRIYFYLESFLLKHYECKLFKNNSIEFWAINNMESLKIKESNKNINIDFLPPFNGWELGTLHTNSGFYCLYHGNLSVPENIATVNYLLDNIVPNCSQNFVFAGKKPPHHLLQKIHQHKNACIISNPDWYEMDELIQKAQICLIPSLNSHGIKLKLIHSLYLSKHCIVTPNVVAGTLLNEACIIAEGSTQIVSCIEKYMNIPFTQEDWEKRRVILQKNYNNKNNAQKIIKILQLHDQ